MNARLNKLLATLAETFWLVPAALVLFGIAAAMVMLAIDRNALIPVALLEGPWLYNGGATGARTLLGAVASSTIGVAGTVFSITIAALSLAAGQMGPRLLRNFTKDRGNQITLGIFLGTFSYALVVLRSVRTRAEGEFIPHSALTLGILLAFVCVGTLVYFVGHMAGRINVDTVIELVSDDVSSAIRRLTSEDEVASLPDETFWAGAVAVIDERRGYLQHLDHDGLADWASAHDVCLRLLSRPGDYRFPGTPIAEVLPAHEEADDAIRNATAMGPARVSSQDLEFAIRQLVEVAVRALSPGINDPHTAIIVLDRLGAALCDVSAVHLSSGVTQRAGRVVLVVPSVDYGGLTDSMFHMIRQNAAGSTAVLMRIIEVLTAVVSCEPDAARRDALQRHADLVLHDALRDISTPGDLGDVMARHATFLTARASTDGRSIQMNRS